MKQREVRRSGCIDADPSHYPFRLVSDLMITQGLDEDMRLPEGTSVRHYLVVISHSKVNKRAPKELPQPRFGFYRSKGPICIMAPLPYNVIRCAKLNFP